MNAAQAKRIPLRDILTRLGFEPQRAGKGELWYLSPFRRETEPSFKIKERDNVWYDHGEGQGGNVLDFALRYWQLSSIRDALRELSKFDGGLFSSSPTAAPPPGERRERSATQEESTTLTNAQVKTLANPALVQYLARRGISADLARPYVQELHYTRGGKPYFALAFANASGGYELRNPYFKGAHGTKDITLIERGGGSTTLAVFEGFMDFLSALTLNMLPEGAAVMVLNSVALREKAIRTIRKRGPAAVYLYLDHDQAGEELTAYFRAQLPGFAVLDQSDQYAGHMDLNAMLEAQTKERNRPPSFSFH